MAAMSASKLDFTMVNYLSRDEFPGDSLEHVSADLILGLSEFRERLGAPIVPSPLVAGWYRKDGSKRSRHYAVGRLADGGDFFPRCDIRLAFLVATGCEWFGGIGVYLDTNGPSGRPEPMMHLDCRGKRTIWLRYEGRYIYPLADQDQFNEFWKRLNEVS